jgi:xylan 1,4-beta-xylosidase
MIMIYSNPVLTGFYPDPSICSACGKYYLVNSSFQYFPGVPLFESGDLINWKQIGHCLTRPSQVQLTKVNSSRGVFAPTIRYYDGIFYMTVNNNTLNKNYYVSTTDIYGEWSDPVEVDMDGIDPSLYFENGSAYYMTNGSDESGAGGIVQCEIDIRTGKKLSPKKLLWKGAGGRYLEGPHLYKINGTYYLLAAEGGTEYGHMITYAVSDCIDGPYTGYPFNPVLTNRNMGGFCLQGIGHGDLVQDGKANWWMIHLGFRQTGKWMQYHHLGRETFLSPVTFGSDAWFSAGEKGTVPLSYTTDRIPEECIQVQKKKFTFENTGWDKDWCCLRIPDKKQYTFEDMSEGKKAVILEGSDVSINDVDSPAFLGIRQKEFSADVSCSIELLPCEDGIISGEAGITLFMDENHHYDLALRIKNGDAEVVERLSIGDIKHEQAVVFIGRAAGGTVKAQLVIQAENLQYDFFVEINGKKIKLGSAQTRYLSSEVAGGFTGTMIGLYAYAQEGKNRARFTDFCCEYK